MPDPIVNIADTIRDTRVIPISELRDGDEVFDVFGHSLGPVRLVKPIAGGESRYKVRSDPDFRYLVAWRGGGTITVRQARPDTTGVEESQPVGHLDLYHRTTPEAAARVYSERRMISRENTAETYWSNRRDGQASGYGQAVIHIRIPEELAELEDEFPDGEQHYRVPAHALQADHFVAPARVPRTSDHPTAAPPAPPEAGTTVSL